MFAASKTASVSGGYQISRSLRFNSADSAYLNRTPASATNRRTWTYSVWLKRGQLSASDDWRLLACRPSSGVYTLFSFINTGSGSFPNALQLVDNNGTSLATTPIYRDPSAWYHIVLAVDTTQATAANRVRIYANGVEVTAFSASTYPTQNVDLQINTANAHNIGRDPNTGVSFFDGYHTEINFIDGTQLTPSSFGETNAQTGVWQPKAYSGSYGTNGFYLNFSDNSNTTAATLGKDYSGNGNNWTPNNFSVTAGAGNDSLVDSPTSYGVDTGVGGEVRGNYATLNPLNTAYTDKTFSDGNLNVTGSTTNQVGGHSTMQLPTTGQWYAECVMTAYGSGSPFIGVNGGTTTLGASGASYRRDGTKELNGTGSSYGATWTTNDVIGIAVDTDSGSITFYKNGTSQGVAYTTLNTNFTNGLFFSCQGAAGTTTFVYNFGQRPFAYTAPSGFKALCTQNLPTPTIGATTATQAGKYFGATPYSGTSATQAIVNDGFQPDLIWLKSRNALGDNGLYDSIRGISLRIVANNTSAEASVPLDSFNSNGFSTTSNYNNSGQTLVAWQWRGGGTGVTNTAGSITSTVSASTASGFSVVTYTGTGANATVGHGLGVAPSMVIYKNRTSNSTWIVYHTSISPTNLLVLNESTAQQNLPAYFNSLAATSSVLNIGSNSDMNASGASQLAYCFAEVAGYSKFGSYTGNGSTDGPFVFTGMRPAFVIIRRTAAENWYLYDVARGTYNVIGPYLQPNLNSAETSGTIVDFLSNGFKIRESGAGTNTSASTYIYMAFASNPFKYSLAR
jgi:hypothetical protein